MNREYEPTIHIHTVMDVRTFFKELRFLMTNPAFHHNSSWSNVIRVGSEYLANLYPVEVTVEEAIAFMKQENFPIRQLLKRGMGIKQSMGGYDDLGQASLPSNPTPLDIRIAQLGTPTAAEVRSRMTKEQQAEADAEWKRFEEADKKREAEEGEEHAYDFEEADRKLKEADEKQAKILENEIKKQNGGQDV